MRAAAWPVETTDRLRSPRLAEAVDRWLDREQAVARAGARLSDTLHAVVPRIPDVRRRGLVLGLRRHIYRSVAPIPTPLLSPVLGSAELREHVRAALRAHADERVRLAAERAELETAFRMARCAEQEALFETARDPAFLMALYVSSPTAFAGWERARAGGGGVRVEQITMTLYGYVMRAVGRATPKGLWAGVALEDARGARPEGRPTGSAPGNTVEVFPRAGRVRFAPALEPFAAALHAIGARDAERRNLRLHLNPTLRPAGADTWQFEAHAPDGQVVGRVATHPLLPSVVSVLRGLPARPANEIQAMLGVSLPQIPVAASSAWIRELVEAGILLPALTFPPIYADAWEALREVIARLPAEEQGTWERAVARLAEICTALDGDPARLALATLRTVMEEARGCVGALLQRYGVRRMPPGSLVLHADLRLPFRFVVSEDLKTRIAQAIRSYWRFDRYGLGETEAAIARWERFGRIVGTGDLPLTEFLERQPQRGRETGVSDGLPADARAAAEVDAGSAWAERAWEERLTGLAERSLQIRAAGALRRWYEELGTSHARSTHHLAAPPPEQRTDPLPPGTALLLLGGEGPATALRLGGVAPDPCLFYARFHQLMTTGEPVGDAFARWYRAGLRRTEAMCPGLEFVDLGVRIRANLSAAARPRLARRWVDPLGIESEIPPDSRLRLGPGGRPLWIVPSEGRILVPCIHSAVTLAGVDPVSRVLCEVSQLLGRPSLMRPLPALGAELAEWRHLPRLVLEDTVVSPERWWPPASLCETLARSQSLERFVAWRRFVRGVGLPEVVHAKYRPHGTEMLLPADSLLALEHLGRALAAHGGGVQLQEVFPWVGEWWLRDGGGRRYLAELGVSWHGDDEFWREYWLAGLDGQPAAAAP